MIIGALNWGLIGLFRFNLVSAIFGRRYGLSRLIYLAVGLSAVFLLSVAKKRYGAGEETDDKWKSIKWNFFRTYIMPFYYRFLR